MDNVAGETDMKGSKKESKQNENLVTTTSYLYFKRNKEGQTLCLLAHKKKIEK